MAVFLSWTHAQEVASKLTRMMKWLVVVIDAIPLAWLFSRCASRGQSDPAQWPPIIVTQTNSGPLLLDGYHRIEAAKRFGLPTIAATIQAFGTLEEVIEFAFQANLSHGLPSSSNTRSEYAYWLFITYPDLQQTEIARRAGIKPSTVNVALKRRAQQAAQERLLHSSKDEERWDARRELRDKEIERTIRSYVHESQHLYKLLDSLDSSGDRYWALHRSIAEGEKTVLFRLLQFLQAFLKEDLPADLTKSLNPPARRTKKQQDAPTEET